MQSDRDIFFAALDVEDERDRIAFVHSVCQGRDETRVRVEALLANHFAEDAFMGNVAPAGDARRTAMASEGTVTDNGRYKLLEKIGEGGVGDVYVAEQREPVKRKVALKVIKLGMDTRQVVARFEMERQALALMEHPNIAKVLDGGATEAGRPYFIMELVRGARITQFCDENCLTTKERLRLFIQVCHAVQHAHQKGIIHRDLKPSNILVTLHDGAPAPKVIDFGIAKATEGELTDKTVYTHFHQFIGTPAYMSPEQAEMSGLDIDTRTDIYSLGVLLYELLTGSTPFDAKKLAEAGIDELRKTIRETDAMRPSTRLGTLQGAALSMVANQRRVEAIKLAPLLKGDLDWIVMKCLEKDRTRRYATVQDLSSDLQRHLSNEPILARPPTAAYRLQKAWRRHRLAISSAVALTVILIAGVALSLWQAVVATDAKRAAIKAGKTEQEAHLLADTEKKTAQRNLYAANLGLIPQAWEHHDLGRVRQLLEETSSYADRGFEWFYWRERLHSALTIFRGHYLEVKNAAFSHDGARMVSSGNDGLAIIWNVETGQELISLQAHTAPVLGLAWSPDDRWIATAGHDHAARLWDTATGKELVSMNSGKFRMGCAVFSPDGKRLAAGASDGSVYIWALPGGTRLTQLPAHSESIDSIAFSADGQYLATASIDGLAKVFEAATGRLISTLSGHTDWVRSVAFTKDGKQVLTSSEDGTARLWDTKTGIERKSLSGHTSYVTAACFSPDETRIATAGADWTLKLWNAREGLEFATYKAPAVLNSIAFSPDGRSVLTGSDDGTALIWNLKAEERGLGIVGDGTEVEAFAFTSDGQRGATADRRGNIQISEVATGRPALNFPAHAGPIFSMEFSRDDRRLLSASGDGSARISDATSGGALASFKFGGPLVSAAFSPDERQIVVGGRDSVARVVDVSTGKELLALQGHSAEVSSVAFSPDGKKIAGGARDGMGIIWSAANGRAQAVLQAPKDAAWWVAFSPDSQKVVTGGLDRSVRVWNASDGRLLFTLDGHSSWLWHVSFTPDGRRILTGSFDRTGRLWDVANGREVLRLEAPFVAGRFVKNGQLVTGGEREMRLVKGASPYEVAEWNRGELAAESRAKNRQHEAESIIRKNLAVRDRDPGLVKDWLIAAPFLIPDGMTSSNALWHEFLPSEHQLAPREGETARGGSAEIHWVTHHTEAEGINFNRFVRQNLPMSVAYAACCVISETAQDNVQLLVGSDDHSRVFLNGEAVYSFMGKRYYIADEDSVSNLHLNAGPNVVVFKVVNHSSEWKGGLRFTDADGKSLKGLKIRSQP